MIIWLGVGVSFARCLHTDAVSIQLSAKCHECCSQCCEDDDDDSSCVRECMEVHIASISKFTVDHTVAPAPVLSECDLLFHKHFIVSEFSFADTDTYVMHDASPPPRLYLNLLSTLVI